jgi:hypothetical protein
MAINRRFLYAGLFLVTLGGVLVAVDLAAVETRTVDAALRLWPLAIIAIGAGIVLRRSRFALVAGVLAAMVPGLVLGGGLAVAPRYAGDCGAGGETSSATTQQGAFEGSANVSVTTSCGSLAIGTQPGNAWQLTSSNTAGHLPSVTSTGNALSVSSTGHEDWGLADEGRDTWNLSLPTGPFANLDLTVNAGRANVTLPGATIDALSVVANGAEIAIDATDTSLAELNGDIHFGLLSFRLPGRSTFSGEIRIGAGQLELCTPPGLGVRLDIAGSAREVRINGLRYEDRVWMNDEYAHASYRADLSVKVSFGAVVINSIGGCK